MISRNINPLNLKYPGFRLKNLQSAAWPFVALKKAFKRLILKITLILSLSRSKWVGDRRNASHLESYELTSICWPATAAPVFADFARGDKVDGPGLGGRRDNREDGKGTSWHLTLIYYCMFGFRWHHPDGRTGVRQMTNLDVVNYWWTFYWLTSAYLCTRFAVPVIKIQEPVWLLSAKISTAMNSSSSIKSWFCLRRYNYIYFLIFHKVFFTAVVGERLSPEMQIWIRSNTVIT